MKILAFIPARGGSKRLPGKNIKCLGGKPLIAWTIEAAKGVHEICDVLVSTDDAEIAAVSNAFDALVPWLRPEELATDEALVIDVALHALDWYQSNQGKVDGILLLQPTSPFRTVDTIRAGIQLFKLHDMQSIIGVSEVTSHPMWSMKIEQGVLSPFMETHGLNMRSQDLTPAYAVNGCFYLISPTDLHLYHTFFLKLTYPLVIDSQKEALDIDTKEDWDLAEYWVYKRIKEKNEKGTKERIESTDAFVN